jgi:hypothetical protein
MSHDPDQFTARPLVFAVVLAVLFVGHTVGDHVLQTDRQAREKAAPGRAGYTALASHLVVYHATIGVLLALTAVLLRLPLSPLGVAAGLAFSALTHGLLDRRWPVRALLRATGSAEFADATGPVCGMYLADQALHHAALLVSGLLVACL